MVVKFVFDEGFSERFARGFRAFGFRAERVPMQERDTRILHDVGAARDPAIWITKDVGSAFEHRYTIEQSGASIAFLRPGNSEPPQAAFLTLSFIYRFSDEIVANPGSYYLIRELRAEGRPRAVVNRLSSLDDLRRRHLDDPGLGRSRRAR